MVYGAGFFLYVDPDNFVEDLSKLGVATAALSFVVTEVVEFFKMLYDAWKELRAARLEREYNKGVAAGVERERERQRKAAPTTATGVSPSDVSDADAAQHGHKNP